MNYLKQLFVFLGVDVPVYQLTVIGGLPDEKRKVQQFKNANLVCEDEVVDRIQYIRSRQKDSVNVDALKKILDEWQCTIPGIDKLHRVYVNNFKKQTLPKKCKKILIK